MTKHDKKQAVQKQPEKKATNSGQYSSPALIAIYLATLISGGAGLAYEVVWSRMLVVPLGNSSDATALVLAAFMLGIALGALLLGSLADRIKSPLKLYALLEVALGVWAFCMPWMIRQFSTFDALRGSFEEEPATAVLRLAAAGTLVLLPSLAMGATIPVLVRIFSFDTSDIRRRVGIVYGANTVGAAIGASVTGFVMLPTFGLTMTSAITAAASFTAAIIAFSIMQIHGSQAASTTQKTETGDGDDDDKSELPKILKIAALVAAMTGGFVMLAAEVLWNRVLTFVFGHDTYAFSVLLAVVLLGLGIGGFLHRRVCRADPTFVLGMLTGLFSLSILISFWVASALIINYGHDPFDLGSSGNIANSLHLEFYREILFAPFLVLFPSILSGAMFPAACTLYATPIEKAGKKVGTITLFNGAASALGSLVTSFGLIAWIGIQGALVTVSLLAALMAIAILVFGGYHKTKKQAVFIALPVAAAVIVAIVMPSQLPKSMLHEAVGPRHQIFQHYEEGRTSTVSVTENTINGEKQLFMNAVNEVTTRLVHDQSFKLLGHLGPLLHPKPERGLMICLGAGLSAGAALQHPLKSLDVVELSASIPRGTKLWAKENNNVLEDPRFHLHLADGRHYLLSSDERYDVIMVDSTHPKAVDSWLLYTKEFYELSRNRLDENGMMVQWVPLHGLSEREFKIIVKTFKTVFPEMTMWVNVGYETYGQAAYVKLVGTAEPLLIDYKELALRLSEPRIRDDLEPFGMSTPDELLDCFLSGPTSIGLWVDKMPIQTDDRPIVPYTTKYSKGRRMTPALLLSVREMVGERLRRMGTDELEILTGLTKAFDAQGFLLADMLDRAIQTWPEGKKIKLFEERALTGRAYYLTLANLYLDDPKKQFEIGSYLGNMGYPKEAMKLFEKAFEDAPEDVRFGINLALVLLDLGEIKRSAQILAKIIETEPDNGLANYNFAVALIASDETSTAIPYLKKAIELSPGLLGARLALSEAFLGMGRHRDAEVELRQVVAHNPWISEAWDMLGLVYAARNEWQLAANNHMKALNLEPYRAAAHYNLGIALQEQKRLNAAKSAYQTAIRIEPNDAEAHNNLGLVYAAAGLFQKAAQSHIKALDVEPHYPEAAYNLGLAYRQMNKLQQAAESFAIALELSPTLEQAREQLRQIGVETARIEQEKADPEANTDSDTAEDTEDTQEDTDSQTSTQSTIE